ncbi:cinnamyl alcohol dehydrogenase 6, partial [Prunus dulcis]
MHVIISNKKQLDIFGKLELGTMSKAAAEAKQPVNAYGWAARDSSGVLSPFNFSRRHEIVGQVTSIGHNVTKFRVGDIAGVGCIIGSCGPCDNCKQDLENYCPKMLWTFNGHHEDGTRAFGGYSDNMVVEERYAILIPNGFALAGTAPLLCAGITAYSPLKYFGLSKLDRHLGVAEFGGVGHMAVKFAKAFGAKVTVISSSPSKKKEAVERLGADSFLVPNVVLIILNLESVSLVRMTTQTVENAGNFALQVVRKEASANYLATIIIAIAYILYCGICHGDIHLVKNKIWPTLYPTVPGHEIVGQVIRTGKNVTKFRVGDIAGVGCIVGSCGSCDNCKQDLENYCPKMLWTFQGQHEDGTRAFGGYSDNMVVEERYAVLIPNGFALAGTAHCCVPGLQPPETFCLSKPTHLGVVGLGGLGHMAVKFAKALGVKVTVVSSSPSKQKEAVERLGADSFLVSHDQEQLEAAMGTMDGIIDTVSSPPSLAFDWLAQD